MTAEELYNAIGGDYKDAKSRLMNDKLISKFIVKFLADPSYDSLVKAWDDQDADAIFKSSHTLKGVCANLALTQLRTIASDICEAYRPGNEATREAANVPKLMEDIKAGYADCKAKIEEFAAGQQ